MNGTQSAKFPQRLDRGTVPDYKVECLSRVDAVEKVSNMKLWN
jgi:hypothetical protein